MLSQIFRSILLLSCVGGALFLILLCVKPITKRVFGSSWQYYMWLTVLIVMVLPVTFKFPVNTPQILENALPSQMVQDNNIQPAQETIQAPALQSVQSDVAKPSIMDNLNRMTVGVYDLLIYVWLSGACFFLCMGLINYWLFLRTIRKNSVPISCPELHDVLREKGMKNRVRVRATSCINAPLMVGVFWSTLLLPNTALTENELRYVLLHELTHLKRHDLWYKWFSMLVNALHWFNPFVYFTVRQINEECEISCDLSVTQNMTEQEKSGYMNTILTILSQSKLKKQSLSTAMASDKKQIRRRFMMIKNQTKKGKITLLISAITAIIIIGASVFASGILNNATNTQLETDIATEAQTNLLLIGVDANERADSIMVVTLNREENTLAALSIPRDTLVTVDSQDYKISSILGNDQKLIDAVRNNLGIPVNYYARINFEGFRNIIDILGGVSFLVPIDMRYSDPAQDLNIDLKSGLQILDGSKAEQLMRYRVGYPEGDIARIKIQQAFIIELMKQKFDIKFLTGIKGLYSEIAEHIVTNYPLERLAADVEVLKKVRIDDIKGETLAGTVENRQGMQYYVPKNGEGMTVEESMLQSGMYWAVPSSTTISSKFGERVHPVTKETIEHKGIDISAEEGENVCAVMDGKVLEVGYDEDDGNYIIIEHNDGITSKYAALGKIEVYEGQTVMRQDTIGLIGATGKSTGFHLHFEIAVNGVPVDPMNYDYRIAGDE